MQYEICDNMSQQITVHRGNVHVQMVGVLGPLEIIVLKIRPYSSCQRAVAHDGKINMSKSCLIIRFAKSVINNRWPFMMSLLHVSAST